MKLAFTYYVTHMATYTRTYGALAAIVIFLVWVNLSASVLLWGAELRAVLLRRERENRGEAAEGDERVALAET